MPLQLADGSNYLDWYFQNMAWSMGGQLSKEWTATASDPKTIAAGTFLQDLAKNKWVKFSKSPDAEFSAGVAACALQSTGTLGGITKNAKFEFGTAFLPGDGACPTGGAGVAIPAGLSDERKKNAVKFIEYLTNVESTVTVTQATGYLPVRKSALHNDAEKAFLEKNPVTKQMDAVKNKRYIAVAGADMNPSLRTVDGVEKVSAGLDKLGLK